MRSAWIVLVACSHTDAPPVAAKPTTCDLSGSYRLRYRSNGADGWWLRFSIKDGKAALTAKDQMDVFDALALEPAGCTATITSRTDHAGDTQLAFTLDPATNLVTGQVSRTQTGEGSAADTVPATGRRDVGPIATPPCLRPGVYSVGIGTTTWKTSEGTPGFGTCADMIAAAQATVRVEMLGDQLIIDEVSGDDHGQSFQRAVVTRHGDCKADVALEVQDFSFDGTVTFAGGTLTGVAKTSHYQVFEDGTAGENMWGCKTTSAPIEGKRIAD